MLAVLFLVSRKNPSLAFRLTAVVAALLIAALSVFAASPTLHAWLHDHGKSATHSAVVAASAPTAPSHAVPDKAPEDHDDGCVVALFAAGILAVFSALLSWLLLGRVRAIVAWPPLVLVARDPRYRLPPLCGPPTS